MPGGLSHERRCSGKKNPISDLVNTDVRLLNFELKKFQIILTLEMKNKLVILFQVYLTVIIYLPAQRELASGIGETR